MKEFVTPVLVDLDINETAEPEAMGSGGSTPVPTPIPSPEPTTSSGCWINWKLTWTGHNNGGHSVCHISASHCGDHCGNTIVMNFTAHNFSISDVKNASGCTISNVSPTGFTLTRNNFFNQTDNIGFNVEVVSSTIFYDEAGNPLHGAIGEKNKDVAYLKLSSYTCM